MLLERICLAIESNCAQLLVLDDSGNIVTNYLNAKHKSKAVNVAFQISDDANCVCAFNDPFGWDDSGESIDSVKKMIKDKRKEIQDQHAVIFLMGIHMLEIRGIDLLDFVKWVFKTFENDSVVISAESGCFLKAETLYALEYICSSTIRVLSNSLGTLSASIIIRPSVPMKFQASFATEHFAILQDGMLKSVQSAASTRMSQAAMDPAADLTFNLKLTEGQRNAKDALQLPYMHKNENFDQSNGSFNIDQDDQFEDDDPDYDLEI